MEDKIYLKNIHYIQKIKDLCTFYTNDGKVNKAI